MRKILKFKRVAIDTQVLCIEIGSMDKEGCGRSTFDSIMV